MNEEFQICIECHEEKVLEDFPIDRRAKTGYKKVCKSCFNEKYKDRNKKVVSPEKVIKEYLNEQVPEVFKALSIQSIAEERDFMQVFIESIQPKAEFINIVNQYKSKNS
ncbi:TraR/DksA family transcriptional regulator [Vallitalea okinawensis]|uniref:TraR/DksA family transcriptional regulator n=1 Tax=Vallitalea okinawensis TaxID=2078660 RepID=UPI000CFDFEE9|nr:TraR/DksA family transcriptional regulator [Vallitalea okinawensis]